LEESLALRRTLDDNLGIAAALQRLGLMAAFHGDYVGALALLEKSVVLHRALDDKSGIAADLHGLGDIARYRGEHEHAVQLQCEALCLRQELGDKHGIAWSLNNLGWLAYEQGEYEQAAVLYAASLDLVGELGDRRGVASLSCNLGHVARHQGRSELAANFFATSLRLFRELNNPGAIAYVLEGFAALAAAEAPPVENALRAARLFGAAQALRDIFDSPVPSFDLPEYRQNVEAAQAQMDDATWATAFAAGCDMLPEQVIDYALSLAPPSNDAQMSPKSRVPPIGVQLVRPIDLALPSRDVLSLVVQRLTHAHIEGI
jgi:tetratricopeptide (TPR) repeat protein